ncbi:MAG: sigma-70 family RNA polymerase sigma factor [Ardenticatenales bacterium]|jgi:RNA polymerase sigma-70 factor (ECF subfamily)|nr:sigma-70 family RNA polymerase sigma factor [Ardenticatenales bacterium]
MTLAVPHRPPFVAATTTCGGMGVGDARPAASPRERSTALGGEPAADAVLVARIAAGDARAHAQLYDHHAAALLHYLRRLVADPLVAEELLHDVFLDAWRGAAAFRGDSRVITWLLAIAHSRGCNELRRRATRSPAALAKRLFDRGRAVATAADPHAHAEARLDVAAALGALPAAQAVVVDLVYWHGLSLEDVARVVDAPLGTVKSRLSRARTALRALLAEEGEDADVHP